jgi:hypothetical protein
VEARGSAGTNGFEGQAALAVTNHVALTVSGLRRGSGRPDRFISNELGLGYYHWATERTMLGLYGGVGSGAGRANRTTTFGNDEIDVRSRYVTAYVQPTVFWNTRSGDWNLGVATRLYFVQYRQLLRTTRDWTMPGAALLEVDDSGLQQAQVQFMFEAQRHIMRRLTFSSRIALQGVRGTTPTFYEPYPLLLNIGLTFQLGNL